MGCKHAGFFAALEKFGSLFGLNLGHISFGASESLPKNLQGKDT